MSVNLKGGMGDSIFKAAVVALLIIIAFFLYLSWTAFTNLSLFTIQPYATDASGDGLGDYINDFNDFTKKFLDHFI